MSRFDRRSRLAELERNHGDEPQPLKPRLENWLLERILRQCGGHPDPGLMAWLETRQVSRYDVARWRDNAETPTRNIP
jgi:hypothetical protein